MKIIYVVSSLKSSGPTNQLFNIISNLDFSKTEVKIITLSKEVEDSSIAKFHDANILIETLNLGRFSAFFTAPEKLKELIYDFEADVIHTQGIRADIIISKLKLAIPHICTIRNIPQLDYKMTYGVFASFFMKYFHIKAMRSASLCVGVSKMVSSNISELGVKTENIKTIENGVDTSVFFRTNNCLEFSNVRSRLSIPQNAKVFISSGHLSLRKDPEFVIKSFISAFDGDGSYYLVFIGDGELRHSLANRYKNRNIIFLGKVKNVSDYLKAADYYISASKAEGLPNAVIEALACGLPVILSDIEPHHEVVTKLPDCGFLFQIGNYGEAIKILVSLVGEDYDFRSFSAKSVALEFFSAITMSTKYQNLYIDLIARARK